MPLSDDFAKSRLEYLQTQMQNNKTVTQQFYPRYQRQYNEAFPYTEGNIKNIVNPVAQIIQENAQPPNDAIIEDSLKTKLNELTKNTAVTDDIFNRLQPEERYYYDKNFDAVTKELMKKIKLPTSKEEFSLNLAMILNNDNNRNNVLGIKNYVSPPAAAAAAATPGAMMVARTPVGLFPATPVAAPPATPVAAAPPAPRVKGTNTLTMPPHMQISINRLKSIHKKDTAKRAQAEEELGNLAVLDNLTAEKLARFIKLKPRAAISQQELDYAETLIRDAKGRISALVITSPPAKGKDPTISALLTPHKAQLTNAIQRDVFDYKTRHGTNTVPPDELERIKTFHKAQIKDVAFRDQLRQLELLAASQNRTVTQAEYDNLVAEHENIFKGFGMNKQSRNIKDKQAFHDKYAIDRKQLKKNILALKYLKNANHVATFKPIEISDSFKSLIETYVLKGNKIEDNDFKSLSVTEKRVLKRLYSFLKMDHNFDNSEDFQKQFQVMYGSFLAGNNNEDLIKQLKEYVKLAISEAIISKAEGNKMLHKLNK